MVDRRPWREGFDMLRPLAIAALPIAPGPAPIRTGPDVLEWLSGIALRRGVGPGASRPLDPAGSVVPGRVELRRGPVDGRPADWPDRRGGVGSHHRNWGSPVTDPSVRRVSEADFSIRGSSAAANPANPGPGRSADPTHSRNQAFLISWCGGQAGLALCC